MTSRPDFRAWFETAVGYRLNESLLLTEAFAIAVCRVEEATKLGARDPINVLCNGAGEASRRTTKAMFRQLGYTAAQIRIMQRVLAGSASGWPGMIRLFAHEAVLTPSQRLYVRRQLKAFESAAHETPPRRNRSRIR
jgi:hypothetical protein